jgi:hypothetical protein
MVTNALSLKSIWPEQIKAKAWAGGVAFLGPRHLARI